MMAYWKLWTKQRQHRQIVYLTNADDDGMAGGLPDGVNDPAKTGITIDSLESAQHWVDDCFSPGVIVEYEAL